MVLMEHRELLDRWRRELEVLRRHGAVEAAATKETDIATLEAFDRQSADELLDLTSAALERGVHPDTVARYIKAGRLTDRGRPGSPRVRRGDLFNLPPVKKPALRRDDGLPDLAAEVTGQNT